MGICFTHFQTWATFFLRGIAETKAFKACMLMTLLGFYVFFPVFILSQLCQRVGVFVYVLT